MAGGESDAEALADAYLERANTGHDSPRSTAHLRPI